ncbi:MAG: hypothetical protein RR743_04285, partial [Oscillospiraceae bacterium]
VEEALANLKTALTGTDSEAIKTATETLTQAFYKVSEKLYAQHPEAGADGGCGCENGGECNCEENGRNPGDCNCDDKNKGQYYDADYEVVDDDKNK